MDDNRTSTNASTSDEAKQLKFLWEEIRGTERTRGALTTANYDPEACRAGYGDFRKELIIKTFIHGPRADLHFEAKVPRSTSNELGMTVDWFPETRADVVTFLRELADLIEKAGAS